MANHDQILAAPRPGQSELAGPDLLAEMSEEPYPGLRSFRRDETHIFFGREDTINEMVDRLAAHRFLAVTGASGSGKSSLVYTGLLDALDRGLLAKAGPDWRVADFAPGDHPLAKLTDALAKAIGRSYSDDERAVIGARLARGPLGLIEAADIANSLGPDEVLLIQEGNRAHALMFLWRTDEARNIYLKYRGQKISGDKSWDAEILSDFDDLRKHGLSNPLMDEVKKQFARQSKPRRG
jgi:hypothetical protein